MWGRSLLHPSKVKRKKLKHSGYWEVQDICAPVGPLVNIFSIFKLDSHGPCLAFLAISLLTFQPIYSKVYLNDDKVRILSLTSILWWNYQLQQFLNDAFRVYLQIINWQGNPLHTINGCFTHEPQNVKICSISNNLKFSKKKSPGRIYVYIFVTIYSWKLKMSLFLSSICFDLDFNHTQLVPTTCWTVLQTLLHSFPIHPL